MGFAYIIKSLKTGKFYVGSTRNLETRLKRHNFGSVRSTQRGRPWRLVYFEKFFDYHSAVKREFQIKSYKGGHVIKNLIKRGLAQ